MPFQKGNQLAKRVDHSAKRVRNFITVGLANFMQDPDPDDPEGVTRYEKLAAVIYKKAVNESDPDCVRCISMIWERVEGKPTERKHSVTERHNIDWGTVSPDVKEQIRELSRRAQELLSSARDDESAVVDITPTDGHAL